MLLPILAVLSHGSKTARAFYQLQTVEVKLGCVVDPKQPPLSVKICLPDLAQGYIHYSSDNYYIRQGLRCCRKWSPICQQNSDASQDALKLVPDSSF